MEFVAVGSLLLGILVGAILSSRSRGFDVALDRNMKDKLKELPPLFERAHATIDIATDFDDHFFGDEKVKQSLKSAIDRGAKIRFLTEREALDWYKDQAQIEIKCVEKLPYHTMVVDDRIVRVEKPHEPLTFGEDKHDVALIFKGFPTLAAKYGREFQKLWTTLSSSL
ncbi:MAG: hypothetical protein ABID84_03655 [Chloroflexota bacterium]